MSGAVAELLEVADLWAGGGGTTQGIEDALDEMGLAAHVIAVNHWAVAISTHKANHKRAEQFLTDLDTTRPIDLVPGGYLDLLWGSPECTYFSRARGGKPVTDQQRMSPWTVIRWLTDLDVRALLIENVGEFTDWGPVDRDTGKPIKARKGQYFNAWLRAIQDLGYEVGYRLLNAADFGDATTRTRFFLQARKDGVKLHWPEATHSRHGSQHMLGGTLPWRPAAEIIDWSNPGPSLFDRKKPLSLNTRRRIARGLSRYADPVLAPFYIRLLDLPVEDEARFTTAAEIVSPFTLANRNNNAARPTSEPIAVVTTAHGGGIAQVQPTAFVLAQGGGGEARPSDEPMPTIVTKGAHSLTNAAVVKYYSRSDVSGIDEPVPTVTTRERFGLASFITKHHGQGTAGPVTEPIGAITTNIKHGVGSAFITKHYGTGTTESVDEPMSTITTGGDRGGKHHGLVVPEAMSVPYGPKAEARPADRPLPTILTKDRLGLVQPEALVVGYQGREDTARLADEPLTTITAGGKRHSLLTPEAFIVPRQGEAPGQLPRVHDVGDPYPTITTTVQHHLVEPTAMVLQMSQTGRDDDGTVRSTDGPLPTVTTHKNLAMATATPADATQLDDIDPRRLIEVDGQVYVLDIRFRMFANRELADATGFPSTYKFSGKKAEVTAQIGNAVCPKTAKALVMAVLRERRQEREVA